MEETTPPGVTEQIPGVDEVKVTVNPEEAVAVSVTGVPRVFEPGLVNVMV